MPETESGALERGREAFERRAWGAAFDRAALLRCRRVATSEDLERLGEAARWSRHFDEMLDIFERASAGYESAGERRSAARVAVKLTLEHHARHGDALAAGWLARARAVARGRARVSRARPGPDVHGAGHVLSSVTDRRRGT